MSFPLSSAAAKRILVAGAVLPFALLASAAQAQEDSQWKSGEHLYDSVCGHCHKPEVGVGPVLEGRGLPEVYIKAIVRNGFNAMPAFPASFVDDESIAKVAEYLSTLPAPAAQP
ncbi:c-type cytochrome [Pseudomonas saliphila]|uniref:c-type cytochrome n=1 Tax=Pseudomonas saliphila TaxID=2586906 RepID=UPI00123B9F61|nr:cytochrome c [Pseudomonas saliphila]